MKNNTSLSGIYIKYKIYLIPFTLCVISLFIISGVIMPQYTLLTEKQKAIEEKKAAIAELNTSFTNITAINAVDIDTNLAVVKKALPADKDIIGIFSSLSSLSQRSGAELKNFSIKIGDVFSQAKQKPDATRGTTTPSLPILATLKVPSYKNLLEFSAQLYESLPLAEIKRVSVNGTEARVELNYYYKPVNSQALIKQEIIPPLTPQELSTLAKIKEWENAQ